MGAGAATLARPVMHRATLPTFSFMISVAIILVTVIAPEVPAFAESSVSHVAVTVDAPQQLTLSGTYESVVVRDNYGATSRPKAPIVAAPDPGSAKAIAYELVASRGWGEEEYGCLVALWERESHWNAAAMNPYSGAYGIPQSLPGNKMASAGADWQTNPATQIQWGLGYIAARYSTPCGAWEHSETHNWY